MASWGLDYLRMKEICPDIIMASLQAFGQTGPRRDYVSFGPILMAYSGMTYLWRDPEIVIVTMRRIQRRRELRSAIIGSVEAGVEHIDAILVCRISVDPRVIKCTLPEPSLTVHQFPRRAAIIRAEYSARVGFDDCVDTLRVGG